MGLGLGPLTGLVRVKDDFEVLLVFFISIVFYFVQTSEIEKLQKTTHFAFLFNRTAVEDSGASGFYLG